MLRKKYFLRVNKKQNLLEGVLIKLHSIKNNYLSQYILSQIANISILHTFLAELKLKSSS